MSYRGFCQHRYAHLKVRYDMLAKYECIYGRLNLLQIHHLKVGEEAPFATGQTVFVQTSKHHTVKFNHLVTKMFEDTAHNTVTARMEFDADALLAVVILVVGDGIGSDGAIVKLNAISNAKHIVFGQGLVQSDVVKFRHLAAWVGEFLGQVAVVGEQQQSCSALIKTTYGENALGTSVFNKLHHGVALIRVIGCGNVTFGLIEQDIAKLLSVEGLAAIHHFIFSLHFVTHGGNDFSIHLYATSLDEVVSFAARANATVGQIFVEANLASRFRTVILRVFLTNITLAATAWLFVVVEITSWAVIETAVATT